jgi:hypothetical protein
MKLLCIEASRDIATIPGKPLNEEEGSSFF